MQKPPEISYDEAPAAVETVDPPAPVQVVELPRPLPLPGQMKPVDASRRPPEPADPTARVNQANAAARIQPVRDGFINSMQVYPFTEGALYQVYTAVGQITDIGLQPGEQLVGSGPVAAGDTVRWIIGDTQSGSGATLQVHKRDQNTAGGRSEIACRREEKLYRRGFMLRRCVNERIEFAQSKGCGNDSKHAR